jgi:phosphoglycerate kinase
MKEGGIPILMSHFGRPKGKRVPEYSLKPVAARLAELLGKPVTFADDCIGPVTRAAVLALKKGDCMLLENLRFYAQEEANDPAFAKELAALGDVYVNDAFGSAHRAHASTEGITKFMKPAVAGYLMEKEINFLGRAVGDPARPYVAIIGGAKISGKIDVIHNLLNKVDTLLIGGAMMFTFYKAQGLEIGDSLLEADKVDLAARLLKEAAEHKVKLLLPVDTVVADAFDNDAKRSIVSIKHIPAGWRGLDIGPESIRLFNEELSKAKTIVWNGPMGVFEMEHFSRGTVAIVETLADRTRHGAVTIIGGGDSAAAVAKAGLEHAVSHVSTGGGASLEFLEGKILPGVAALTNR